MKKILLLSFLIFALFVPVYAAPPAPTTPEVEITIINPPANGVLNLNVGESYTIEIQVNSSETFIWAKAVSDQYYPGNRYVTMTNMDMVHRASSATLYITLTAVASTADLPAVCDFPGLGTCWAAGTAPVGTPAGARFGGGFVASELIYFTVAVP